MIRKAFTLVELLVVIAIIALLISILAPSLKMAKDLAKQAICATRLRGAGSAANIYAAANREGLPPYNNSYTNGLGVCHLAQVYRMIGDIPVLDSTGQPLICGTWSYLLKAETLTPDAIYCPSQSSSQWERKTYPGTYGVTPPIQPDVWSHVRYSCGYMFNLTLKQLGTDTLGVWEHTRLGDFPTDKVLASDILMRVYDMSHGAEGDAFPPRGGPSPTWQVAYADSHVAAKSSLTAWGLIHDFGLDLFADVPEWIRVRAALLGF